MMKRRTVIQRKNDRRGDEFMMDFELWFLAVEVAL